MAIDGDSEMFFELHSPQTTMQIVSVRVPSPHFDAGVNCNNMCDPIVQQYRMTAQPSFLSTAFDCGSTRGKLPGVCIPLLSSKSCIAALGP